MDIILSPYISNICVFQFELKVALTIFFISIFRLDFVFNVDTNFGDIYLRYILYIFAQETVQPSILYTFWSNANPKGMYDVSLYLRLYILYISLQQNFNCFFGICVSF